MKINKKNQWLVLFTSLFIAGIIRDFVNDFFGLRYDAFANGFLTLYFVRSVAIFVICFIPVYLLILKIKNRWLN